jgi:hypothetical protein
LASIADIRLGGVTGDVSFFLMNEDKRKANRLPVEALTPVVSRARHLRSAMIASGEWNELRLSGERVWLFNPQGTIETDANVVKYLRYGTAGGGCKLNAHKVCNRSPWFRTPMPESPDAFLSGMSERGPWLCINELEGLNATNTLYILRFRGRHRLDRYLWALAMLTASARTQISRMGRHYADGLVKYEPGSLGRIQLPTIRYDVDHKLLYMQAVEALKQGDWRAAIDVADSVVVSGPPERTQRPRTR